jgi:hypothetical protein
VSVLARRWLSAVPGVYDAGLRAAFLRNEISTRPAPEVATAIDHLCELAEQAHAHARDVLGAMMPALTDPAFASHLDALRAEAASRSLLALGRLLRRPRAGDPGPLPLPEPDERTLVTSASGRPLTLGERRALARRPTRAALDKLLRDPHPMVIRNLLANSRVTEEDVVRLAARRPAYPDVLIEIARHVEWSRRARVRMALIQNPRAPVEITVPLLRLLIRPELVQILQAADVAAVVRAAASELLERRPPVPEREGSTEEH